ncbi:MAG TPA: hypothetical protein VGF21_07855 [Thermoleophilaceae bacterium]|jgi:hypothetical protein
MRYGRQIGIIAIALALAGGGQAHAESTAAVDFELGFVSRTPGSVTGMRFYSLYKDPSDPRAKPSPLREVTIEAPAGTRFNGAALPACHATDMELKAQGRDACPASSRVGGGSLTVMTGFGPPLDPVPSDATLFNSGNGVIELFTQPGTNATLGIDRTTLTGPSTLTAHPPVTPGGPPDGESSVREVHLAYDTGAKPFIRTPASCPPDGRWVGRLRFRTKDGHAYSARSTTPCTRQEPRLHVRVAPRRVRAGQRRRFRVRVRSSSAACVRAATIHFAGRRVRTNRRGRASLRLRLRRTGRRRLVVTKRGCRRAIARVRVRR